MAHIAAAYGALDVLRLLHSKSTELFDVQNAAKKTPLQVAQEIGEEDAALLIVALLEGKDDGSIGLAKDLEIDDDCIDEEPPTPSGTPRTTAAKEPDVAATAAVPPASPLEVS